MVGATGDALRGLGGKFGHFGEDGRFQSGNGGFPVEADEDCLETTWEQKRIGINFS